MCDSFRPPGGTYAGIGSRDTPADVLGLMSSVAAKLGNQSWTLRTGGARGADRAFLDGATSVRGGTEVYLPWPQFEDNRHFRLERPSRRAYEIAARHHPAWTSCTAVVQALLARNGHQVLGEALNDPATFIVCYTPDGSLTGDSRRAGGTGQALRVATSAGVPVFNLQRPSHRERVEAWLFG